MYLYSETQETARSYINYIKRDNQQKVEVRTPDGQRVTSEQMQRLAERSEQRGYMSRAIVLQPVQQAEWSHEELDKRTRQYMRKIPGSYIYAIHDSEASDSQHVHAVAVGRKDELGWLDYDQERERAHEVFQETEKMEYEAVKRELDPSRGPQLENIRSSGGVVEYDLEEQRDRDRDRQQEAGRDQERDQGPERSRF